MDKNAAMDAQVKANALRQQAETARVLVVDLGYSKDAAIKAVTDEDLRTLIAD